jgi:predicted nucleic acid-binding protein
MPLAPEIVVPEPVLREIMAKGKDDVTARAVDTTPWLSVVPAPDIPAAIAAWELGEGEASVLAWVSRRTGAAAVLDDLEGRRCAESLGVPVLGTVAVVLRAKRRGQIPIARPILQDLVRVGMYLLPRTLDEILRRVGE